VHIPAGAGMPTGMNVQTPGALWAEHVMHASVQAVLQHTPPAQKPLWHSPPQPHASPFERRALASLEQEPSLPPSFLGPLPPPHAVTKRSSAQAT